MATAAAWALKSGEDAVLFNVNGQGKRIVTKSTDGPRRVNTQTIVPAGRSNAAKKEKSSVRAKVEHVFGVVRASFDTGKLGTEVCENRLPN